MLRFLIFMFIAALGFGTIMALLAAGSEWWNDDYPHKIQCGLFPYWQCEVLDNEKDLEAASARKIESGLFPFWRAVDIGADFKKGYSKVLYTGVIETGVAVIGVILIVYLAWIKLVVTNLTSDMD